MSNGAKDRSKTCTISSFAGAWNANIKIYVPSASLEIYKAARGFSSKASYIVGYED